MAARFENYLIGYAVQSALQDALEVPDAPPRRYRIDAATVTNQSGSDQTLTIVIRAPGSSSDANGVYRTAEIPADGYPHDLLGLINQTLPPKAKIRMSASTANQLYVTMSGVTLT